MRFITNPATNLYSTSIYQTLSQIDSQSNIKVSILSNKCNTLFNNLPKTTQFFSLKLQYPSIIASQFANCIIYSSGLKKTSLNSVKAVCRAGFWGRRAGGSRICLGCVKTGKKAGERMGTGESQENMRVFSSVLCFVPYLMPPIALSNLPSQP